MLNLLGEFSLSLYQGRHFVVRHRLAELEVHLLIFLKGIHHFLYAFLHHLQHCLVRIHLRFLLQIAHCVARSPYDLSLILFFHSGDDFHQCGFSGTVQTYDADFGSVEKGQIDVLEYYLIVVGKNFSHPVH